MNFCILCWIRGQAGGERNEKEKNDQVQTDNSDGTLCRPFAGCMVVRGHLIHEPFRTNVRQAFQAPCREYIFGTDNLGRCVACRILYGAATSLYAAVLAVFAVFIIGTAVGVTAAYAGGIVDRILMKITLVFQAFPNFILAVAVAGMLGTGLKNSVLALGAVYWITYAKLSRSLVLSIRDSEYIRAQKYAVQDRRQLFLNIYCRIWFHRLL